MAGVGGLSNFERSGQAEDAQKVEFGCEECSKLSSRLVTTRAALISSGSR